jgi:hypothetical protein
MNKENFIRALAGEDGVQSLRCRLGLHRWTKWVTIEPNWDIGRMGAAKCHCADCGLPRIETPVTLLNKSKK